MRRALLLFLLAFPVVAQLPPGVTRIPYSNNFPDAYFVAATSNGVLWTRSAIARGVIRVDLDGRTENVQFPNGAWPGTWYYGLTVGPDGALWTASPSQLTRVDPVTNAVQLLHVGSNRNVTHVESGPDGNLWLISQEWVSRMRTDGMQLSMVSTGTTTVISGTAFGTDGALYLATTMPNRLVRITANGERSTFPAATRNGLFAGTGFLWSAARQYDAPGDRAPAAEVVKLSYTGQTLASYQLPMTPLASDALGNLWLRTTTAEGDFVAELSPAGVLTKYGPIPPLASAQCFPRYYGGLAFLNDGRLALADHFPDLARTGLDPCFRQPRPAGLVNVITILDPRLAPIAGVEHLDPPVRRRIARH